MNLGKMKSLLTRRMAIPAIVAGTLIAAGGWALVRPASAAAAPNPAPAAAPIDESSVAPLLSFDQAMEALTARVRPAVVNVNVTSKLNEHQTSEEEGARRPGTASSSNSSSSNSSALARPSVSSSRVRMQQQQDPRLSTASAAA